MFRLSYGLCCILFLGCSENAQPIETNSHREIESSNAIADDHFEVVAAVPPTEADDNALGFDLYSSLSKRPGNLVFSPYSISSALAMIYAGARGQTEAEIAAAAHFGSQEQVHKSFAELRASLDIHDEEHQLIVRPANRLWGDRRQEFLPDFLAATAKHYGADLTVVDFAGDAEGARQQINAWVEKQTDSHLKELVPPGALDPSTRLALISAIYFSGKWAYPFMTEQTKTEDFEISSGKTIAVPTMKMTFRFPYINAETIQILELPFRTARHGEYAMFVLLPKRGGLKALENKLTAAWFNACVALMKHRRLEIHLPKFRATSTLPLNRALRDVGMRRMFEQGEADLSGMSDDSTLFVQQADHAAFIRVDEEGAVAAAATRFLVAGLDDDQPILFRADHPFVFAIRHNPTRTIHFIGRITNPAE